jgi:hypothetical protein
MVRYKWFFIAAAAVCLGLLIWVIYLRYLLARKSIESRAEVEKHRLELAYKHGSQAPRSLSHENHAGLVTWEGEILGDAPDEKACAAQKDISLKQ